ncbi:MAG: hypothetical protein LBR15_06350 [Methanobrevibacter sp.]|jgi:hypothetical protein|nr:hypothetical protein [Candidatus Methanovirga australis]
MNKNFLYKSLYNKTQYFLHEASLNGDGFCHQTNPLCHYLELLIKRETDPINLIELKSIYNNFYEYKGLIKLLENTTRLNDLCERVIHPPSPSLPYFDWMDE